jgi:hypothetical protein
MSRKGIVAGLVMLTVLFSLSAAPVQAADASWSKGDKWVYSWAASEEGLLFDMDGSMEMKVDRTTSDSYVMSLTGTATVSGTFMNASISGSGHFSGSMTRAKANFGAISTTMIMNVSVSSGALTIGMEMGVMTTASPPLNDLPINQALVPGMHIWSNSTITGTSWFNIAGFENESDTISTTEHLELVVGANETITTPAGTFECIKLSAGALPGALTYYYSEEVGNYVKVSGTAGMDIGYAGIGDLTLESYSYGESGIMSFITGKNWWVTALIIAAIAAFVVGLVAMRRRGRMTQMAPPPTQQMPPPPPTS